MNPDYYTQDGRHPEDVIRTAKTFINELQHVQETYFNKLVTDLSLSKDGEEWLFDYIYNTSDEDNYDDFEHYLQDFKQTYRNFISIPENNFNPAVTLLSTDFAEDSPMLHMSSYEADLETCFPSYFDEQEIVLSELQTISFKQAIPTNE